MPDRASSGPANPVKESHLLAGDPRRLAEYYDHWAGSYERDARQQQYRAPQFISDVFQMCVRHYLQPTQESLAVLDAGCGTGLVGCSIAEPGRFVLDGFDLSHEMVEHAKATGRYRWVSGGVDLNRPLTGFSDGQYDLVVACGVFTLGHVFPHALDELLRVTRSGGMVIVSTRPSYVESSGFDQHVRRLGDLGHVKVLGYFADAPYIEDERAHYWVLRVS